MLFARISQLNEQQAMLEDEVSRLQEELDTSIAEANKNLGESITQVRLDILSIEQLTLLQSIDLELTYHPWIY